MSTLNDVLESIDALWPFAGQESWDASGLVSGDPAAHIERIHLAVDPVAATVDEAVSAGADLLITHHPLLLRGVTSIAEDRYKGALLARLIRAGCALLSTHTNTDVIQGGVSDVIAARLGLTEVTPLEPRSDGVTGVGRIGRLPEPVTLGELAGHAARVFPATAQGIRVAGEYTQRVQTVALCGGAGDSYLGLAAARGADVYLTSDLRHHPASEFREQATIAGTGPALIDVAHWASEWLWLDAAAEQLRAALPGVEVTVSEINTDPFDFSIPQ